MTQRTGRLLDTAEAAHYLATTTRHLRRLVAADGLAVVHLGGKRRFRQEDLDDLIRRATVVQHRAEVAS